MFENIGATIKKLAFLVWFPILIKYYWEAYETKEFYGDEFPLLIYMASALIVAIVTYLVIYGFGQSIENSSNISKYYKNLEAKAKTSSSKKPELEINPHFSYSCKYLTKTGSIIKGSCSVCGRIGDLEYCSVTTADGNKGYSVCQDCKDKFIANSEK